MARLKSTRAAAKLAGDTFYFTGIRCKHGHAAKRMAIDGHCIVCHKIRAKAYYRKNSETFKAASRKRAGVPSPTRKEPAVCECCGSPPGGKGKLNIDHNHTTGAFRGWLCDRCNLGIGLLRDRLSGVLMAANYLRKHDEDLAWLG